MFQWRRNFLPHYAPIFAQNLSDGTGPISATGGE
jgi:hypothetical protein